MKKVWLRVTAFVLIFGMLFTVVQDVLKKKWYYPNWDCNTYKGIHDMYMLSDNSVDVVFAGNSHMQCGVSPMEIYEYNNIVSYNLGTVAQPIEVTYYLLKEFMNNQQPKVLVLDSSNLFYDDSDNSNWRYALESMKFGKTKLEMAKDYSSNKYVSESDGFFSAFFPIYKYHSRWQELNQHDWELFPSNSFLKGYYMWTTVQGAPCTVDVMNEEMDYFAELENSGIDTWKYEIASGEDIYNDEEAIQISDKVTEEAKTYLTKIKELCMENDCELILTQIPAVNFPQYYNGAWTLEKYQEIKSISEQYDIKFVDLLYDEKLDIDVNTDFADGGQHINFFGAKKISKFYADYLHNKCGITGEKSEDYDESLEKYIASKEIVELSSESNFESYMNKLKDRDDIIVLISTSNNFAQGMSQSQFLCLKEWLNDQYSAEELYRKSLVGIVDDGLLVYEEISQINIEYNYEYNGTSFEFYSGGLQGGWIPSIKVNGIECSQENNAIDFVVYNKTINCVIDSVSFGFVDGTESAYRGDGNMSNLQKYIFSIGG